MLNPIETEGVQIEIEWRKFIVGSSFFVPCIDTKSLRKHIEHQAKARDMRIRTIDRVENTLWGIRVWRLS
jgi:hypothetical protein